MNNKKLYVTILAVVGCAVGAAHGGAKTGTWGDQGDGTYKNPILDSNFPDDDIIRVGDTFYKMSSSNHLVPGMTILKSKDLVNWEYGNPIMPAPITYSPQFEFGYNLKFANNGTWAGQFGYNGEDYFAYWCETQKKAVPNGHFRFLWSKAKSMDGPWSEPKELTWPDGSSINQTDPGVLFDLDTKKAWLSVDGTIYQLSWDGSKLLQKEGEGIESVPKSLSGEAAKLYKIDGTYYAMNVHVSGRGREQVLAKATNMEGPWESRIVLEVGKSTHGRPAAQGTLLKLDDGSWWFMHQLGKGTPEETYNGRVQMLEPVEWKADGWPLIGVDTDGNGIGEVVWQHKKPIAGFPVTAPATDDDFNGPKLGPQWLWSFNPKMDRWSLTERPGFLRLKACAPEGKKNPENLTNLPNVIGQRLLGKRDNVMTAKLDVSGLANGGEAGLHVSAGESNAIGVRKDAHGKMHIIFKSDAAPRKVMEVVEGPVLTGSDVWLQSRVNEGVVTFAYSFDGKAFTPLGDKATLRFWSWTPDRVGFYSSHPKQEGYVDVDSFRYDYDGPKGQMSSVK